MATRAVLDTNIWVSAILNPSGFPAEILRSFRHGDFLAVISEPIISEIVTIQFPKLSPPQKMDLII